MNCVSCKQSKTLGNWFVCFVCEKSVCTTCVKHCVGKEKETCLLRWCPDHAKQNAYHCTAKDEHHANRSELCLLHVRMCRSCGNECCDWVARVDWVDCGTCFKLTCGKCRTRCINFNKCGAIECVNCNGRKKDGYGYWMCDQCNLET